MRWSELAEAERELLQAAREVRRRAHAPYSGFRVGAAVRARDGRVFPGCNVENASLGASLCAERGAVMRAVAEGMRRGQLESVAVFTTDASPTPPCGMCLQCLVEFGRDPVILLANARSVERTALRTLLTRPFTTFPRRSTSRS